MSYENNIFWSDLLWFSLRSQCICHPLKFVNEYEICKLAIRSRSKLKYSEEANMYPIYLRPRTFIFRSSSPPWRPISLFALWRCSKPEMSSGILRNSWLPEKDCIICGSQQRKQLNEMVRGRVLPIRGTWMSVCEPIRFIYRFMTHNFVIMFFSLLLLLVFTSSNSFACIRSNSAASYPRIEMPSNFWHKLQLRNNNNSCK